jgi:REP element-mobilizing transposase RayT
MQCRSGSRKDRFFFITVNCEPRHENHLCRAGAGDAVLRAFASYHEDCLWHCRVALLMPDHLHAIIAFPREPGIKTTMTNWKKYLARTQQIRWQRDFFDHRLRGHHEAGAKMSYVLMNPVRKGLCERAEDWPWVYHLQDRSAPAG